MKNDRLYKLLREKMYTVSVVPPQNVGPLTILWRRIVPSVKTAPLRVLISAGLATSLIMWYLLGPALVGLVSLLQYGF